jgi:hypothetical protein
MTLRRFLPAVTAIALLAFLSACASKQAASSGEAPSVSTTAGENIMPIEVNHNRSDGGTTTIYVEPAAGVRHALGTISPGERKTFPYRIEAQNRTVTLSAINASGQTMRSTQITVPQGAGISWDLQVNSLRIRR